MKRNRLWAAALLSLGLALSTPLFNPLLHAQSHRTDRRHRPVKRIQRKSRFSSEEVVKIQDGRYALVTDEQAGKGLYLDDSEKAKGFEGKNVKVTGVLEVAKNIVHVSDIQLA